MPGDIDESGRVDGQDLISFSHAKDSLPEDPNWNPKADITQDGYIDDNDLAILTKFFGKRGLINLCWVADTNNDQVVKLSADGSTELARVGGFSRPYSVSVNPADGTIIKYEWDFDGDGTYDWAFDNHWRYQPYLQLSRHI